ncbi:hypothetical protein EC973_000699 [Apophysomyces ossiformis]|uniref:Methyltransferase type 11 domain-containing protein n=1 Tax=Apophysomyces ossiformis TaxID=679940 RepID=A0A8H7EP27_9FUNG|nr:hypothetical protein EC973_000699 [Apophysomyces ossiformis]
MFVRTTSRTPLSSFEMHQVAATGFNLQVEAYAKTRPSYPETALRKIEEIVPQGAQVLDLAAGPGVMTQLLVASGYRVTAVEPVENMRKKLIELLPGVPCHEGTAQNIPLPSESQDAVVIAQAFHWFDDIESLKEVHRVLKPQGCIILIWNMESPRSKWVAKLRQIYERYSDSVPQYFKGGWKKVFETEQANALYDLPLKYTVLSNDFPADKDTVWSRITTKSYIAVVSEDEREKLRQEIFAVLEDPEYGFDGIYPHETDLYWASKRA